MIFTSLVSKTRRQSGSFRVTNHTLSVSMVVYEKYLKCRGTRWDVLLSDDKRFILIKPNQDTGLSVHVTKNFVKVYKSQGLKIIEPQVSEAVSWDAEHGGLLVQLKEEVVS